MPVSDGHHIRQFDSKAGFQPGCPSQTAPRRIKLRHLTLAGVVCLLLASAALPTRAWIEPGGPDAVTAYSDQPHTHGQLILDAITLLRRDGHAAMADACAQYRQALLNGARAADTGGGTFTAAARFAGITIYRDRYAINSMEHFYDGAHARNRGMRGLFIADISRLFPGSAPISRTAGPHPDAASTADWHYARAMQAMRADDQDAAYFELGYTLHLVQDLCVPQHSANALLECHSTFELQADALVRASRLPLPAGQRGEYDDDLPASGFVQRAAAASHPLFDRARNDDPGIRAPVIRAMLTKARGLSAGLLHKFSARWATEAYSAICFRIDHVQARRDFEAGEALSAGKADFRAAVAIRSDDLRCWYSPHRGEHAAWFPTFSNVDDLYPNAGIPLWTMPARVGDARIVRISCRLADRDLDGPDDRAVINPSGATPDLYLRWDLQTRSLQVLAREDEHATACLRGASTPTVVTVAGADAKLTFSLDSIYLPAAP